jgi:hypothetical protein
MSQDSQYTDAPEYGGAPQSAPTARDEMSAPPQMGPLARLGNIFFSPGDVFEDVRRSPRDWWLPMVVLLIVATAVGYFIQYKLDFTPEKLAAAAVESGLEQQGKTRKDLSADEQNAVAAQEKVMSTMFKLGPITGIVFMSIFFGIVSLAYWVLLLITQARTTFFRVLSVVAYAYFVPNVLKALLQGVLALMKGPGDVDAGAYMMSGGLITASPAAFVSVKESPALWTLLSYLDVFSIWFLILLAIGFTAITVKRMKLGKALVLAIAPYLIIMLGAAGFRALMS